MEELVLCTECTSNPAVRCCVCRFPIPALCEQHLEKHSTIEDRFQHFHLPVFALWMVDTPEKRDMFSIRLRHLRTAQRCIARNLESFPGFIKLIEARSLELQQAIRDKAAELKQKIEALQTAFAQELKYAVRETSERALDEWTPDRNSLSAIISDYDIESDYKLFSLKFNDVEVMPVTLDVKVPSLQKYQLPEPQYQTMELIAENQQKKSERREDTSPTVRVPVLPQVAGTTLISSETRRHLPEEFTCAMYCTLEDDSVLCVGGYPASTRASLLTLSTADITPLAPMKSARYYPGLIRHCETVYVFGGYNGVVSLAASEGYKESSKDWVQLPDMWYGRYGFSPCLLDETIYLIDVKLCDIETFSVTKATYKVLSVKVPIELRDYSSVAFCTDEELFVLSTNSQMGRWPFNGESFHLSKVNLRSCESALSTIPPVRVGNEVWWVRHVDAAVVKFDLDLFAILD